MALLFDRVAAGRFNTICENADLESGGWAALLSSQVVVADNVAEFYFAESGQEVWEYERDFPNLAPPFGAMWIETKRPSKIQSDVFGETPSGSLPKSWGALVLSDENPSLEYDPRWRWRINAFLWAEFPHHVAETGAVGPLGGLALFVDQNGMVVDAGHGHICSVFNFQLPDGGDIFLGDGHSAKSHSATVTGLLDPLLLAVCFMHCKNVKRRDVAPPAPLNRKWERKHGRPLVRYHVLDINPMREVLDGEGGAGEHGLRKALHICRGHFATYTDSAPLFGRVTGTFWKPQHVRGSARNGVVLKDYRVLAPGSGGPHA